MIDLGKMLHRPHLRGDHDAGWAFAEKFVESCAAQLAQTLTPRFILAHRLRTITEHTSSVGRLGDERMTGLEGHNAGKFNVEASKCQSVGERVRDTLRSADTVDVVGENDDPLLHRRPRGMTHRIPRR